MRSRALAAAARADLAQGQLSSAETNFRLALHYAPGDRRLQEELKQVHDARESRRRAEPGTMPRR